MHFGFVEKQRVGADHEGTAHGERLLLAARERGGDLVGTVTAPSVDFNQDGDVSEGDYVLGKILYSGSKGSFARYTP